ncbi:MAG: DUF1232 domain-containing protein [bacterium]|nr:DUF1232 domain-containing protein [bacterium]
MPTSQREGRIPSVEIELGSREQRFYDRVRGQLKAPVHGESTGLKDVLLLLPDLTVLMFRLLRDDRVAIGDKAIALLGVGYVLSPIDLIPDFIFGPFGLIDDVLVLSATLSRLVNHVHPDVVRSHWAGQGDALDAIQRISGWAEDQFTTSFFKRRGR